MTNVVFFAPFYLPTTLRFVRAAVKLEGVRVGIVTQEPADRLPADLRRDLEAHYRVDNGLDADQLTAATATLGSQLGSVDRLLAVLEQIQVPAAIVRERLNVPGMKPEAAANFRDKARMKSLLRQAGLPCARHRLVGDRAAAVDFASETGFPLVAKPPAGAGALSTFRIEGPGELEQALRVSPPSRERPLMLEEFVSGDEHSFDSVLIDGRPRWISISRYLPSPLQVLERPWLQWNVLLPRRIDGPEFAEIRDVGLRALGVLGLETGLSHMEWFRRPDGSVALSEVGARPPGAQITSLLSYAHDFDLYAAWARLMIHGEFETPSRDYAVGAVYLRGRGQGRVVAVHGLEQAQLEVGGLVVEVHLPQKGRPAASGYEGDGYVVVRHPETDVVASALARINELVKVELG